MPRTACLLAGVRFLDARMPIGFCLQRRAAAGHHKMGAG